jgi:phage terminase large subunit-like protein
MHTPRALELAEKFRIYGKETAPIVARAVWRQLSVVERAALYWNWRFWAREKQLPPAGDWKTWGFLTGRRFGKTAAVSSFINDEVEAGRATLIGLIAQDEQSAIDIQVEGPSGLIATAMPRRRPRWSASDLQLTWPNGARAYVRTPESPGKIRGVDFNLFWASELQSWPRSTMEEALANVLISTSVGFARIVWDATAKRRHPLLLTMLAKHEADPERNVVVRGTTQEN